MPLGERFELVADPGKLFDRELFLGVAAGLLQLVLSIVEIGQSVLFFLAGLIWLIVVHIVFGAAHPPGRIRAGSRGSIGTQLGQALELALQVLFDFGLFLGESLQLLPAFVGIGVLLGFARFLQVLSLSGPHFGQLRLGILQLFDQPRQLAFTAVLDSVEQITQLVACLILRGRACPIWLFSS